MDFVQWWDTYWWKNKTFERTIASKQSIYKRNRDWCTHMANDIGGGERGGEKVRRRQSTPFEIFFTSFCPDTVLMCNSLRTSQSLTLSVVVPCFEAG